MDWCVMIIVILALGCPIFPVEAALPPGITSRNDGLYNVDLGNAFVSQTAAAPTTVTLDQSYLVYGARIDWVSGKGYSDPGASPGGTLGDSIWGSWTAIYLNGQPATVLVPSFGYDGNLDARYTTLPGAAYKLKSADLVNLMTGYDLWCRPRQLPKSTAVSIWNSDPIKTDNSAGTTVRWYLIVGRWDTRTRTMLQSNTKSFSSNQSTTPSVSQSFSHPSLSTTRTPTKPSKSWSLSRSNRNATLSPSRGSASRSESISTNGTTSRSLASTVSRQLTSRSLSFTSSRNHSQSLSLSLNVTTVTMSSAATESTVVSTSSSLAQTPTQRLSTSASAIASPSRLVSQSQTVIPLISVVNEILETAGKVATITTATTASTGVAAQGSPMLASQASRLAALRALLACNDASAGSTSSEDQPLDAMAYPLGLPLEAAGRSAMYNAPAVLFDSGVIVLCLLVNIASLKGAEKWRKHPRRWIASFWKAAERYCGFLFAFSVLFFSQPITTAAVTTALVGTPTGVAIGAFGIMLSLAFVAIPIAVHAIYFRRAVVGEPRPSKAQCWRWFFAHSTRWTSTSHSDSATQLLRRRWGVWFEGYCSRAPWFVVVELVLNVVSGVAGALTSAAGCRWGGILAVVAYAAYFLALVVFRPQGVPTDFLLTLLIAVVQLVATVMAVQNAQPEASATMLYISSVVSAIFGLKELLRIVVIRYKRLKAGGLNSGRGAAQLFEVAATEEPFLPVAEAAPILSVAEVNAVSDLDSVGIRSDRQSESAVGEETMIDHEDLLLLTGDRGAVIPRTFNPLLKSSAESALSSPAIAPAALHTLLRRASNASSQSDDSARTLAQQIRGSAPLSHRRECDSAAPAPLVAIDLDDLLGAPAEGSSAVDAMLDDILGAPLDADSDLF